MQISKAAIRFLKFNLERIFLKSYLEYNSKYCKQTEGDFDQFFKRIKLTH